MNRVLIGIISSVAFGVLLVGSCSAAPTGLTLSPLRTELDIAPGTSQDGALTITNTTDRDMSVQFSSEAFSVINQQYDYAFDTATELSKWVSFSVDSITLSPGENKSVGFTIGVPLSAEPGGRYISLFASNDTLPNDAGISSRQRVASLVYITVLGDVSRVGSLISLSSPAITGGESQWTVAIRNSGSTHFRSRYSATVQNLFGGTAASMSGDALILPGTVRSINDKLPTPSLPGIYKVVYNIGLGDTPAVSETRYLLYMPPVAIIVLAVAAILATSLLVRRHATK